MKQLVCLFLFALNIYAISDKKSHYIGMKNDPSAFSCLTDSSDTISITEIYKRAHGFFEYMSNYHKDSFSLSKTAEIVKIYNTLFFDNVRKRDSAFANKFTNKFIRDYFPIVAGNLQIGMGRGATIYSILLDMYIGPSMKSKRNDIYFFWVIEGNGKKRILE